LRRNKNWVKDAQGKCVKIISQLLFELPANYNYKIIFMERDLDEVIQSQHKMLVRDGKAKEDALNIRVLNVFKQNLERVHRWVPAQSNMEIIFVSHRNLVNSPKEELQKVNDFLGKTLNIDDMVAVVDKSLHREKSNK
jgi:hypothetical protein